MKNCNVAGTAFAESLGQFCGTIQDFQEFDFLFIKVGIWGFLKDKLRILFGEKFSIFKYILKGGQMQEDEKAVSRTIESMIFPNAHFPDLNITLMTIFRKLTKEKVKVDRRETDQ